MCQGVDFGAKDDKGVTALCVACTYYLSPETVKLILLYGNSDVMARQRSKLRLVKGIWDR